MNYIALLLPSVLFCYTSKKLTNKSNIHKARNYCDLLINYLTGLILINVFLIGSRLILGYEGILVNDLTLSLTFSIKYFFEGTILALILPFFIKYIKERLIQNEKNEVILGENNSSGVAVKFVLIASYAIFLGLLHFIRCFNYSFWLDEGYTIIGARANFSNMINYVISLGNTPFIYIIESLFYHTFGESGFWFHFAATSPYFIILFVSITVLRKWFGNVTSVVFITFCSLLQCAVVYNLEVRMYAWCELFILLSFLSCYQIYTKNENKHYFFMFLFSLGAVYSHYYSLASIGILYLFLLFYKIFYSKAIDIIKVIVSGSSVLLFLSFWILLVKTLNYSVITNYRLQNISWSNCFEFIFLSKYSFFLLACFVITTISSLIYDIHTIKLKKASNNMDSVVPKKTYFTKHDAIQKWYWEISGICGVLLTIVFAQIFSRLFYPIIFLRYLYVCYVIIWLLFASNISKLRYSKIIASILIIFIFSTCWNNYYSTVTREFHIDKQLKKTLSSTKEIDSNDVIYTNMMDMLWTISMVYYPTTECRGFGYPRWNTPDIPKIYEDRQGWLFLSNPIQEDLQKYLRNLKKKAVLIDDGVITIDNGFFGIENAFIYKIIDLDE